MKSKIIEVQDIRINTTNINEKDYICISDIAKAKSDNSRATDAIKNYILPDNDFYKNREWLG